MSELEAYLLSICAVLALACAVLYAECRARGRWVVTWRGKYTETNNAALFLLQQMAELNGRLALSMGQNEFYKAAGVGMRSAMDDMRRILNNNKAPETGAENEAEEYGD